MSDRENNTDDAERAFFGGAADEDGPAQVTRADDERIPATIDVSGMFQREEEVEATVPYRLDNVAAPPPAKNWADPPKTRPAEPVAPPLPFAPASEGARPDGPSGDEVQHWRTEIDSLVGEAQARAGQPAAAALWFEAGRIYEDELRDLPQAAHHYQAASQADPSFRPVMHAARRLFAELANWQLVVLLIDEELKLGAENKAVLLVEKGRILADRLGKPDDAAGLYREALVEDPSDQAALDALRRYLLKHQDHEALAEVLEDVAARTTDEELKTELYVELARHFEARLGRDDEAVRAYELARALKRDRRDVLTALRRLYARLGEQEKLAGTLLMCARQSRIPSDGVPFLLERARLLDHGDSGAEALAALEEAQQEDPKDTLVLGELARMYERTGDWESYAQVLQSLIENTRDPLEIVALHAECGRICEEKLGDVDRAVANYRACILVDPSYHPAHQALGRLFAKTGQHDELIRVYDDQIAATLDDDLRIPLLFNQAELLAAEAEHGDPNRAIGRLEDLLHINPDYLPAAKLLSVLYHRQQRWPDLVRMYEEELKNQRDDHQAVFLLEKIGQIYESNLDDLENAADAYRRMRDRIPDYLPALRALGRIYARSGKWEDLIAINTDESQIVSDQKHVVSLLYRNGELLADKLGRTEEAIQAFKQALVLMPNYLPALKALGRIYGKAGRFQDLVAMHRQEAEVSRVPEQRAHLLFTVARLYAESLDDEKRAAETYREILAQRPGYHPALRELARLAERTGEWEALVEVYRKEIEVIKDGVGRALMRCRTAEILDRRLSRPTEAMEAYEAAIADAPHLLVAHQHLVGLCARRGDGRLEVDARQRMHKVLPERGSQIANLRQLAELHLYALDDPEKATESYVELLKLDDTDKNALRALVGTSLQVHDYQKAIHYAERLAQLEPRHQDVAALYLEVAGYKEDKLDPPEDALPSYLKVLEFDPLNPIALRAAEQAYRERGGWDGLYQLYERERSAESDPARIIDLSMKMGNIAERKLKQPDVAAEQFEMALSVDQNHLPAIVRLKAIYGASDKPQDELRMLAFEAQASKDPKRAIDIFLRVGALQRDRFGNIDAAAESYFQVLDRDPDHRQAFADLEALLVAHSRWPQLVRLYKGAADASSGSRQVDLYLKAALVLDERLQQREDACAVYENVLQIDANNVVALEHLGEIRFDLEQWEGAVDAMVRRIELPGDPKALGQLHKRLGVIYVRHQPDVTHAVRSLTAALAVNPDDKEARRLLAKAYAQSGSPAQALATHQQLLNAAQTPDEKREEHLALAALYAGELNDAKKAVAEYEAALPLCSPDQAREITSTIAEMYEKTGDLEGYLNATARRAEDLAAEAEPHAAAELLHRAAQLVADRQKDTDRAIHIARRGLELDPSYAELRAYLADLYSQSPTQVRRAIEEHRRIVRDGVLRPESLHALFDAWSQKREFDRAYVAAELLSVMRLANEDEDLFFHENQARVLSDAGESLSPGELTSQVLHPDERNVVHDILFLIAAELGKVNPDDLAVYEVDKRNILGKRSDDSLRRLSDRLAHALGGLSYDVYRTQRKAQVVAAHNQSPPALVVGATVTTTHPTRAQRFLLGRKLCALRCGHHLIAGMDTAQLRAFLSAVGRAVDKNFVPLADRPDLDVLAKRVASALPRGVRKALAEPVAQLASESNRIDFDAFLSALPLTEARAGLLLSADLTAALQLAARDEGTRLGASPEEIRGSVEQSPVLRDLAGYAVSDEHFTARQRLCFAIDA